jgi:RimJ/RimL family protein N-acetyltransferase
MSASITLSGDRVRLRRWRDEDREVFESDAMVDHINGHFGKHDFGLWAIEVPGLASFIGFSGLTWARFSAHFTPCVEVGWRLAFEHWGQGYATEASRLALRYGFETLALSEIVSFTSATNHRSRAVMERLGMRRDPADDFEYPRLPEGHPLRRHVLYRLGSGSYFDTC